MDEQDIQLVLQMFVAPLLMILLRNQQFGLLDRVSWETETNKLQGHRDKVYGKDDPLEPLVEPKHYPGPGSQTQAFFEAHGVDIINHLWHKYLVPAISSTGVQAGYKTWQGGNKPKFYMDEELYRAVLRTFTTPKFAKAYPNAFLDDLLIDGGETWRTAREKIYKQIRENMHETFAKRLAPEIKTIFDETLLGEPVLSLDTCKILRCVEAYKLSGLPASLLPLRDYSLDGNIGLDKVQDVISDLDVSAGRYIGFLRATRLPNSISAFLDYTTVLKPSFGNVHRNKVGLKTAPTALNVDDAFFDEMKANKQNWAEKVDWSTGKAKLVEAFEGALTTVIAGVKERGGEFYQILELVCKMDKEECKSPDLSSTRFAGIMESLRMIIEQHSESEFAKIAVAIVAIAFTQASMGEDMTVPLAFANYSLIHLYRTAVQTKLVPSTSELLARSLTKHLITTLHSGMISLAGFRQNVADGKDPTDREANQRLFYMEMMAWQTCAGCGGKHDEPHKVAGRYALNKFASTYNSESCTGNKQYREDGRTPDPFLRGLGVFGKEDDVGSTYTVGRGGD